MCYNDEIKNLFLLKIVFPQFRANKIIRTI